jgi:hypothetical protein
MVIEWKAIAGVALIVVGSVLQQTGLEPCGVSLSDFGKILLGVGVTGTGAMSLWLSKPPVPK